MHNIHNIQLKTQDCDHIFVIKEVNITTTEVELLQFWGALANESLIYMQFQFKQSWIKDHSGD